MKSMFAAAVSAAVIACAFAGGAWAQQQPRQPKLIQEGEPGHVVEVVGDNLIVVTGKLDCPEWSLVGGICFADVMGQMQQSGEPILRTIGTALREDEITSQLLASKGIVYDVKRQGESFAVTKVGALDVMVPQRCGRLNGHFIRSAFDDSGPQRTLRSRVNVICDGGAPLGNTSNLQPTQTLGDGPLMPGYKASLDEAARAFSMTPLAGPALSIYEFYGDETLVVFPQNCVPEDRLFDGACFSNVKSYMQQYGYTDFNVVKTDANYRVGSVLPDSQMSVIKVLTGGDFTAWKARHASRYDAGLRYPGGCQTYGYDPNKSGVIITGAGRAQFYERMACPPLTFR